MLDPKVVERLHNNQDFLKFLNELHSVREYWIKQLHDLSTDSLQQVSGRILSIDEVLFSAQYEKMKDNWDRFMRSNPESERLPSERVESQSGQSGHSAPAASETGTVERISEDEQKKTHQTASAGKRRAAAHTAV